MYKQLSPRSLNHAKQIIQFILAKTEKHIDKEWAQKTQTFYEGLEQHLDKYGSLSPKQLEILDVGCEKNGLEKVQWEYENEADLEPELPLPIQNEADLTTITVTQKQLDIMFGELARQASKAAFDILRRQ